MGLKWPSGSFKEEMSGSRERERLSELSSLRSQPVLRSSTTAEGGLECWNIGIMEYWVLEKWDYVVTAKNIPAYKL